MPAQPADQIHRSMLVVPLQHVVLVNWTSSWKVWIHPVSCAIGQLPTGKVGHFGSFHADQAYAFAVESNLIYTGGLEHPQLADWVASAAGVRRQDDNWRVFRAGLHLSPRELEDLWDLFEFEIPQQD